MNPNDVLRDAMKKLGFNPVVQFNAGVVALAAHYGVATAKVGKKRNMLVADAVRKSMSPESVEPTEAMLTEFYQSWDWKRCRYDFIKERERRCQCCGATPAVGIRIVVDHVKPIRKHWALRLDPKNLQLLCDDCNQGKGSRDETDWRASA